MSGRPTLRTARLVLRPFRDADAPEVQRLCGDPRIADTTLAIPHPYPDGAAEAFIARHQADYDAGRDLTLAITEKDGGALVGAVGLRINPEHLRGELGYWIAVPAWNRGYATEAAQAVMRWGFRHAGLHRIHAHHITRNPASGRVMEKLGMSREGELRGWVRKGAVHEDVAVWAVLHDAFEAAGR